MLQQTLLNSIDYLIKKNKEKQLTQTEVLLTKVHVSKFIMEIASIAIELKDTTIYSTSPDKIEIIYRDIQSFKLTVCPNDKALYFIDKEELALLSGV